MINLSDISRRKLGLAYSERFMHKANNFHGSAHVRHGFYAKHIKRVLDVAVSSVALVATLPVNAVLAVLTYRDVGSPILFKQERVGKDGKLFTLVKFRNMTNETDEYGNLLPGDQRVTKLGKIVRATSLDELLNFWSVLKGDMSIIGPRPLLPEYTERYCDYHGARLIVRPGLECPPHVRGMQLASWEDHFNNDTWYVEHLTFRTDAVMMLRLMQLVFDRKSTTERGSAARSWFMGYGEDGQAISYIDIPEDEKAIYFECAAVDDAVLPDEIEEANLVDARCPEATSSNAQAAVAVNTNKCFILRLLGVV